VTAIDWAIVAFAVILVPLGWRQGLLVGVLTLAGFAAGALIGSRLGPLLLPDGSESPYAPATALLGGLLIGGILAVLLEGVGQALRDRFVHGGARLVVDSIGGALVMALLALSISWVIGAVVLNAPALKRYRDDVQRSEILAALYGSVPPSGPILNVLNRIDPTPALKGPSAEVAPPDARILDDPDMQAASESAVHVLGSACGLNVSGSGWTAAPGLVVTNAHVVAGEDDTRVETRDGASLDAYAVLYKPRDDLAILAVPGLGTEPLELAADPRRGTPGAVIGFPGAGEFSSVPARLGTTGTVTSQDSYGRGPIDRLMTSFRGEVVSGNSGGPVIGVDGDVLTTVFASTLDTSEPQGLGVPNEIVADDLASVGPGSAEVDTGPCA
jgi:S1-C subfamily serine protease